MVVLAHGGLIGGALEIGVPVLGLVMLIRLIRKAKTPEETARETKKPKS